MLRLAFVLSLSACAPAMACQVMSSDASLRAYGTALPDGRPVVVEVFDPAGVAERTEGLASLRRASVEFWKGADERAYARVASTVSDGELADASSVPSPRGGIPVPQPPERTCALDAPCPDPGPTVMFVLRAERDQPLGAAVVYGEGRMGEDLAGRPVVAAGPDAPALLGLLRSGDARSVAASVVAPVTASPQGAPGAVAAQLLAAVGACLAPQ